MYVIAQAADPDWLDLIAEIWNRWHDKPAFWVFVVILSIPASLWFIGFTKEQSRKAGTTNLFEWIAHQVSNAYSSGLAKRAAEISGAGWFLSVYLVAMLAVWSIAIAQATNSIANFLILEFFLVGVIAVVAGLAFLLAKAFPSTKRVLETAVESPQSPTVQQERVREQITDSQKALVNFALEVLHDDQYPERNIGVDIVQDPPELKNAVSFSDLTIFVQNNTHMLIRVGQNTSGYIYLNGVHRLPRPEVIPENGVQIHAGNRRPIMLRQQFGEGAMNEVVANSNGPVLNLDRLTIPVEIERPNGEKRSILLPLQPEIPMETGRDF